jgi:hypothetical protein
MNNNLVPNFNMNWVPGITLEEMEKQTILQAYRFYRSNKTQTAQALGIAIRTLDNKLEKYEADGKAREEREAGYEAQRQATLNRMRGIIPTETLQTHGQAMAETAPRVHVQPAQESAEKHELPLSKPKEIQSVLPRQTASSGQRGRR